MGTYAGTLSAEVLTESSRRNVLPELAELKGKRLVVASELSESERLSTGTLKRLCSTDCITAEKKYHPTFSFVPTHTLVLCTNHLPRVKTNDTGTWRRLIVIPFNARIEGSGEVLNYADALCKEAGPAVMEWILDGAEAVMADNYKPPLPAAVTGAVAAYREDNDWLQRFIEESCDQGEDLRCSSSELFKAYRDWCERTGEYAQGTGGFYGALTAAGYERKKTSAGRFVLGLSLCRSDTELPA